ncbi:MAG: hypothetical protein C0401_04010 [Anaerolinea sp.]|nr:hypothetical protein [Anaerolinea sp.]
MFNQARTIADLAGCEPTAQTPLAEPLQYWLTLNVSNAFYCPFSTFHYSFSTYHFSTYPLTHTV